jgi:steroid 5-alpha reductase family enzyme
MSNDCRAVVVAYGVAGVAAVLVGRSIDVEHPIAVAFWADVAATVVVFAFSLLYRNSSFYDAYWSVAPVAIALYWTLAPGGEPGGEGAPGLRRLAVLTLVTIWAVRLTWNWARGWQGLHHQDWRYLRIQERTGALYWPTSFAGIHLMPTLWVFLGCLPLYPALSAGRAPLGWLDGVALVVTASAIAVEALADQQLVHFRRAPRDPQDFLRAGLWSWSRHPNYLGEMGFWWGLFLFGLAADPSWAWTGVGAISITLMFRFVSLPMIEERMRERRPGFESWAARSSLVIPRPPRTES